MERERWRRGTKRKVRFRVLMVEAEKKLKPLLVDSIENVDGKNSFKPLKRFGGNMEKWFSKNEWDFWRFFNFVSRRLKGSTIVDWKIMKAATSLNEE